MVSFDREEIKVGKFYQIVNNKLKKHGLVMGELVYAAGDRYVQEDKRDPHNYRKKFLIAKTDIDGHINTNHGYLVDAKSLGIIPEYEQERLHNLYIEDFGDEPVD